MFGPLYYRGLEHDKTQSLKSSRGNFDTHMSLSQAAIEELHWWVASLPTAYNEISNGTPDIVINTDASFKVLGRGNERHDLWRSLVIIRTNFSHQLFRITCCFYALQSF